VHRRAMVLDATIRLRELAALLDLSVPATLGLLDRRDVPVWRLSSRDLPRIGWRAAATLIDERYSDALGAETALEDLRSVRAGDLRARPGLDPPMLEPTGLRREIAVLSDDEARDLVRTAAAAQPNGRRLTEAAFARHAADMRITASMVARRLRYATWGALLKSLDLQSPPRRTTVPRKERLDLLRRAAAFYGDGRSLSGDMFNDWAKTEGIRITAAALIGEYGSWSAAKEKAGLPCRARVVHGLTKAELIDLLSDAARDHGARLTLEQFNDWCEADCRQRLGGTVSYAFGSWNAAKREAGLVERRPGFQGRNDPSDRYPDRSGRIARAGRAIEDGMGQPAAQTDRYPRTAGQTGHTDVRSGSR